MYPYSLERESKIWDGMQLNKRIEIYVDIVKKKSRYSKLRSVIM